MNFFAKAKALAPKMAIWELKDIPIPPIIVDNLDKGWVDAATYYGFEDSDYNIAFRGKSVNLLQDDEQYKSKGTSHIQSEIIDFNMIFQSNLTNVAAETIINHGFSDLTIFSESVSLHRPFLKSILEFINDHSDQK